MIHQPSFAQLLFGIALLGAGCTPQTPPVAAVEPTHSVPTAPASAVPVQAALPPPILAGTTVVSIPDVAARVLPSVVNISSTRKRKVEAPSLPFSDPFFRHFFGPGALPEPQEREERGMGSGVVVADGIVLTNNHVVADADEITVTTKDEVEYRAKTVGTDPKSDLAVLRLEGDTRGLVPISWGVSARLRLGESVLAVGNPFGVGQTVTQGIVSALGRADLGIVDYEDFIQTDAAINPGNSGGALVNMSGELVGINTAILSRSGGSMGIGFAIPSDMARPIMEALLKDGRVVRGWLGVSIQNVDQDLATALGLPKSSGVLVGDVNQGTPAAKAGLRRGDVITKVGDHAVTSTGDLRNTIAASGAGQKVQLTIIRDRKPMSLQVELGEMPSEAEPGAAPRSSEKAGGKAKVEVVGVELEPLTPALRKRLRVPDEFNSGVVVSSVAPSSPAANAQLAPGDLILRINGTPVTSVQQASGLWGKGKANTLLLVLRNGQTRFVLVKTE